MNNSRKKTKKNTKGFVLVVTIFAASILATLVIGMANLSTVDLSLIKNHLYSLQAYYIAEAGVADAIDRIQNQGTLATTDWEEFFPASPDKYTIAVAQGPTTVITSTGLAATANFSRELQVEVTVSGSSSPYTVSILQWKEVTQ